MILTKRATAALAILALLAAPAFAQPPSSGQMEPHPMMPSGEPMSYQQMMARMQANHAAMMRAMNSIQAQLTLAERTNDPAKRRAALESVHATLNTMQARMAQCQQMVQMMDTMMNGRGMMNRSGMPCGMMGSPAPSNQ